MVPITKKKKINKHNCDKKKVIEFKYPFLVYICLVKLEVYYFINVGVYGYRYRRRVPEEGMDKLCEINKKGHDR